MQTMPQDASLFLKACFWDGIDSALWTHQEWESQSHKPPANFSPAGSVWHWKQSVSETWERPPHRPGTGSLSWCSLFCRLQIHPWNRTANHCRPETEYGTSNHRFYRKDSRTVLSSAIKPNILHTQRTNKAHYSRPHPGNDCHNAAMRILFCPVWAHCSQRDNILISV